MSAEENKAVVLRYIEEVWNGHDLDATDELVSPEYLNHAAITEEYRRGGARRAVEWLLSVFPDHRFDVEDAVAEGGTVAVRGTCSGTHEGELMGHRADGRAFRRPAVALVPGCGRQAGGALGGQGRPRHDASAGRHAHPGAIGVGRCRPRNLALDLLG